MKTIIEIYKPGVRVYVIDKMHDSEGKETNYFMIVPAIVDDVTVSKDDTIEYWLKTPSGDEWGDCVSEKDVDDDFSVLAEKCKIIWENDSIYK